MPEAAVIEPDHAIAAGCCKPAIGGECDAPNAIAVIRVAEDFGPLLVAVENAQTTAIPKPGCQISAIRGESEACGAWGKPEMTWTILPVFASNK